ncbi:MAG: hypothetical protein ACXVLF_14785 [Flavisolibacter sp.]
MSSFLKRENELLKDVTIVAGLIIALSFLSNLSTGNTQSEDAPQGEWL